MKSKSAVKSIDNDRRTSLQRRLERHFLTCSAAVGAAAAVAPAQQAQATIHYFDPTPDVQIPLLDIDGIYFNLETGATGTTGGTTPGWDINIYNPTAVYLKTFAPGTTGIIGYTAGGFYYSSRLAFGAPINASGPFNVGGVTTMSYAGGNDWGGTSTDGYLGVTFQLANSSTVFGWIHLTVTGGTNAQVTDWAWEDSGGQILAGAVPEPSSLALSFLAAGAVGLAYWRRRKAGSAS